MSIPPNACSQWTPIDVTCRSVCLRASEFATSRGRKKEDISRSELAMIRMNLKTFPSCGISSTMSPNRRSDDEANGVSSSRTDWEVRRVTSTSSQTLSSNRIRIVRRPAGVLRSIREDHRNRTLCACESGFCLSSFSSSPLVLTPPLRKRASSSWADTAPVRRR